MIKILFIYFIYFLCLALNIKWTVPLVDLPGCPSCLPTSMMLDLCLGPELFFVDPGSILCCSLVSTLWNHSCILLNLSSPSTSFLVCLHRSTKQHNLQTQILKTQNTSLQKTSNQRKAVFYFFILLDRWVWEGCSSPICREMPSKILINFCLKGQYFQSSFRKNLRTQWKLELGYWYGVLCW